MQNTVTELKQFFKEIGSADLIFCAATGKVVQNTAEEEHGLIKQSTEFWQQNTKQNRKVKITAIPKTNNVLTVYITQEDKKSVLAEYRIDSIASNPTEKDMLPKGTTIETYKNGVNSMLILIHSTTSQSTTISTEHTVWIMIRHDKVQEFPGAFYIIENIYLQDPGFVEIKYKPDTWKIIDAHVLQELPLHAIEKTYLRKSESTEIKYKEQTSKQSSTWERIETNIPHKPKQAKETKVNKTTIDGGYYA